MYKMLIFLGMTVFSWIGWWIGERYSITTAFVLSGIGSIIGVYAGWKINHEYFE
jgi:hypothetical protein